MKRLLTNGRLAWLIIVAVLVIDQIIKVCVKTQMYWHESIRVTDWFYIFFTENIGMAFGMEFIDKLFLTLFRVVAVAIIGWMLYRFLHVEVKRGFVVCVSLILAGAVGNIIDSLLYGVLFSESTYSQIATFLPADGGYAPLFYGKVVDMFYFPLIETDWPQWMPWVGGQHFVFFSPIFNFADAAISCGVIALFLFYGSYVNVAYQKIKKK